MRRVLLLVVALILAAPVDARSEPEVGAQLTELRARQAELIRPLLASADDRLIAWGATWIRELSLGELEADLLQLLRTEARDADAVGYYGMLAVLDALIHLDARVEADALRPFLERRHGRGNDHAAPAIVLAIRSQNPWAVLDLFDVLERDEKSWEEGWLALGNTLAAAAPPGFAARCVSGVAIDVDITVRDPGHFGGGHRDLMTGAGDGRLPEREGYPRIWRYGLSEHARAGDTLLVDGPRPIYLRRREALRGFGSTRSSPDRSRDRIAWIAQLLDMEPDDLPLKRHYGHGVEWSTAEAYLASVRGLQVRIASDHSQVVHLLRAAGHLGPEEAETLAPRMQLSVRDMRSDTSVPLPPLTDAR